MLTFRQKDLNMKTYRHLPRLATIKRVMVSIVLLLILLSVTLGALVVPIRASADVLKYAFIEGGMSAAQAYIKSKIDPRQSNSPYNKPDNSLSKAQTSGNVCKAQVPRGIAPSFNNPKWNVGLTTLCFQEFTVAYSAKTRTPLWAAEHLTRQRVTDARTLKRQNTFHEEQKLPASARSLLSDYVRSGYDRGHMAPSGGASNSSSQNDTFSLANIVPQNANNNRHIWQGIEISTRNYAKENGSLYVVTGPLFLGAKIQFINGRVAVPTHLWKLAYDPAKRTGGVYIVENIDTQAVTWKSIAEFETLSGYDFKLGKPPLMPMPQPQPYH